MGDGFDGTIDLDINLSVDQSSLQNASKTVSDAISNQSLHLSTVNQALKEAHGLNTGVQAHSQIGGLAKARIDEIDRIKSSTMASIRSASNQARSIAGPHLSNLGSVRASASDIQAMQRAAASELNSAKRKNDADIMRLKGEMQKIKHGLQTGEVDEVVGGEAIRNIEAIITGLNKASQSAKQFREEVDELAKSASADMKMLGSATLKNLSSVARVPGVDLTALEKARARAAKKSGSIENQLAGSIQPSLKEVLTSHGLYNRRNPAEERAFQALIGKNFQRGSFSGLINTWYAGSETAVPYMQRRAGLASRLESARGVRYDLDREYSGRLYETKDARTKLEAAKTTALKGLDPDSLTAKAVAEEYDNTISKVNDLEKAIKDERREAMASADKQVLALSRLVSEYDVLISKKRKANLSGDTNLSRAAYNQGLSYGRRKLNPPPGGPGGPVVVPPGDYLKRASSIVGIFGKTRVADPNIFRTQALRTTGGVINDKSIGFAEKIASHYQKSSNRISSQGGALLKTMQGEIESRKKNLSLMEEEARLGETLAKNGQEGARAKVDGLKEAIREQKQYISELEKEKTTTNGLIKQSATLAERRSRAARQAKRDLQKDYNRQIYGEASVYGRFNRGVNQYVGGRHLLNPYAQSMMTRLGGFMPNSFGGTVLRQGVTGAFGGLGIGRPFSMAMSGLGSAAGSMFPGPRGAMYNLGMSATGMMANAYSGVVGASYGMSSGAVYHIMSKAAGLLLNAGKTLAGVAAKMASVVLKGGVGLLATGGTAIAGLTAAGISEYRKSSVSGKALDVVGRKENISGMIDEMMEATQRQFSREEIKGGLLAGSMFGMSKQQLKKYIPMMANAASAMDLPLDFGIRALSRAATQSEPEGIERYGFNLYEKNLEPTLGRKINFNDPKEKEAAIYEAFEKQAQKYEGMLSTIAKELGGAMKKVSSAWRDVLVTIGKSFSSSFGLPERLQRLADTMLNPETLQRIASIWDTFGKLASRAFDAIMSKLPSLQKVKEILSSMLEAGYAEKFIDTISIAIDSVISFGKRAFSWISGTLQSIESVKQKIVDYIGTAKDILGNKQFYKNIVNSLVSVFFAATLKLEEVVRPILTTAISTAVSEGIRLGLEKAPSAIGSFISGLWGMAKPNGFSDKKDERGFADKALGFGGLGLGLLGGVGIVNSGVMGLSKLFGMGKGAIGGLAKGMGKGKLGLLAGLLAAGSYMMWPDEASASEFPGGATPAGGGPVPRRSPAGGGPVPRRSPAGGGATSAGGGAASQPIAIGGDVSGVTSEGSGGSWLNNAVGLASLLAIGKGIVGGGKAAAPAAGGKGLLGRIGGGVKGLISKGTGLIGKGTGLIGKGAAVHPLDAALDALKAAETAVPAAEAAEAAIPVAAEGGAAGLGLFGMGGAAGTGVLGTGAGLGTVLGAGALAGAVGGAIGWFGTNALGLDAPTRYANETKERAAKNKTLQNEYQYMLEEKNLKTLKKYRKEAKELPGAYRSATKYANQVFVDEQAIRDSHTTDIGAYVDLQNYRKEKGGTYQTAKELAEKTGYYDRAEKIKGRHPMVTPKGLWDSKRYDEMTDEEILRFDKGEADKKLAEKKKAEDRDRRIKVTAWQPGGVNPFEASNLVDMGDFWQQYRTDIEYKKEKAQGYNDAYLKKKAITNPNHPDYMPDNPDGTINYGRLRAKNGQANAPLPGASSREWIKQSQSRESARKLMVMYQGEHLGYRINDEMFRANDGSIHKIPPGATEGIADKKTPYEQLRDAQAQGYVDSNTPRSGLNFNDILSMPERKSKPYEGFLTDESFGGIDAASAFNLSDDQRGLHDTAMGLTDTASNQIIELLTGIYNGISNIGNNYYGPMYSGSQPTQQTNQPQERATATVQ